MKKNLLIIPMLATLLLAGCAEDPSSTQQSSSDIITHLSSTQTSQGGNSETIPGGHEVSSTITTELTTPPDKDESNPNLPNGHERLEKPENFANPKVLTNSTEMDEMYLSMPDNYRYIWGSNFTNPDMVGSNETDGGVCLSYKPNKGQRGIQTPMWEAWHDDWIKIEVRFVINFFQGTSKTGLTQRVNPFLLYCFDENGNYLKSIDKKFGGTIKEEKDYKNNDKDPFIEFDFENNEENKKIRYVELRLQDYVIKGGQAQNVVLGGVRIRSYYPVQK